jgi:tRNA modification GTPase
VARRYLAAADLVLLCVPSGEEWGEEEEFLRELPAGRPVLLVRTMVDRGVSSTLERQEEVSVSVRTGAGIDALRSRLPTFVYSGLVEMQGDAPVLTRRRQREAVQHALDEVVAFGVALSGGVPAEAASAHLREAESALEELLGVFSGEDILDRVFSDFCIGK